MAAVVLLLEGDILMPWSQESNSSAWWVLPVTQRPSPLSALSFQWLRLYPCLCSSMHLWWQSINEGDEKQKRTQCEPWNQLLATLGWTFTPLPYTGTVLKLQDPACNTTPSLKQNISCIGIKHLGNKISALITVWAKVCVFFGFGIAAPRNLRLRCMIQQSLEGSRFKAPHCYYNYTRARKTAMQHFLTAFYTELVYKAHNKYQKMDFGIISGHAWIIGSVTFVPVPTSPADTGFRALFWFMQAPQPSAIWQLLLS